VGKVLQRNFIQKVIACKFLIVHIYKLWKDKDLMEHIIVDGDSIIPSVSLNGPLK
jgi:hypothetical protein